MKATPEQKEQMQKNLIRTFELSELCMELRKGFLRTQNKNLSEKEINHLIVEQKQDQWKI